MKATATLIEMNRWRVVWFHGINFGFMPVVERNFYGGNSTVLTWGNLFIEWGMGSTD